MNFNVGLSNVDIQPLIAELRVKYYAVKMKLDMIMLMLAIPGDWSEEQEERYKKLTREIEPLSEEYYKLLENNLEEIKKKYEETHKEEMKLLQNKNQEFFAQNQNLKNSNSKLKDEVKRLKMCNSTLSKQVDELHKEKKENEEKCKALEEKAKANDQAKKENKKTKKNNAQIETTIPMLQTYANVTKKQAIIPNHISYEKRTLVIKSNDKTNAMKKLIKLPIHKANIKLEGKKVKENGSVILHFASEDDRNEMKGLLDANSHLNLETQSSQPEPARVQIHNIDEDYGKEDIIDAIELATGEKPQWLTLRNYRNSHGQNAIITCSSPTQYRKLMERNKLQILYSVCTIKTYIAVKRCSHCGMIGHKHQPDLNKPCRKEKYVEKQNGPCVCCVNYNERQKNIKLKVDVNHSIWDKKCPAYIKEKERIFNRTDYGSQCEVDKM